ncbi:serine-type D-Ala-D-Ala carboxypeptidase [Spiribacter sp. 2438]|uniref:D-alanyl-D-alanine carboxypeptidase family protein n=1 Tax=Spiribacter sp. 2438 TaxID=2666185 RepID=UPI0012AEEB33|nr:D-alanyl-D-alanine carboxypeptidase family protein [Spiribacter sp. 2438]QGM22208.1 serine-type D-Ala-D-Ala carboxypeptidase [Spiribacter sp. 2438]
MLRAFALSVAILLGMPFGAAAQTPPMPIPDAPSVGASNYILMDFHTGEILADKASDEPRDPASLTKIMTAFVVFSEIEAGHISLADEVLVSERAWRAPGSRMFIEVDTRVTVDDLLHGMIIQSGNDASVALAEHVAGTEEAFAALMNQYAAELGLRNTQYTNAAGLPHADHYSSAADTARLVQALIDRFPSFYGYYSQRSFTWNDIQQPNRNRMLWQDPSVDGVKTGYTKAAGYCLATSAERDGMRLISVILGADSPNARIDQTTALLNYGYRFFETHQLYAADEAIETARIWRGGQDTVPLGLARDLRVTVPVRAFDRLEANLSVANPMEAPLEAGTPLGELTVTLDDEVIATEAIIALETVEEAGFVGRLIDGIRLRMQ